jgi:phospholipid/cholesterol/gamma-HCH transport system ATP-binding protein
MLVSHDIHESLSIADYLCVVAEGKIVAQGKVADVQAMDSPWLQQFLSGSSEGPVAFHYPAAERSDECLLGGDS